jgi:hypothetical protein
MIKKLKNLRKKRKLTPKKSIASILDSHHKQKKTPPLFKTAKNTPQKLKGKQSTKLLKIKDSIKKMEKTKKALQFALSFGVMLGIFYLLFLSSIFNIKEIQVFQTISQPNPDDETQTILTKEPFENQQLQDLLNRSILKNLILLNTESLKSTLSQTILNLEDLSIQKQFPSKLIIDFKQFDPAANLVNLVGPSKIQKFFLIDENGRVSNLGDQRPDLPTIRIQTNEQAEINKTILKPEQLNYALKAKEHFQENFDLNVQDITYLLEAREVHLYTSNQTTIWLDAQEDYIEQIDKLKKALPRLNIYDLPIDYIDLRIDNNNGGKIIYKER